jgi:protein TonB
VNTVTAGSMTASYTRELPATNLTAPLVNRKFVIGGSVVLFHVAALWALQSGLLRRPVEVIVPVAILSELVTPPAPKVEPPAPPQPAPPAPKPPPAPEVKQAPRKPPAVVRKPAPAPVPMALPPTEAPSTAPLQSTPPVAAAPVQAPAEAPPAPPPAPPPKVELPSSDASYLRNPPLVYPPMSKRMGEQGKVVVRVLIGADGLPKNAQLKTSSGFDRLDRAAVEYVMQCRYLPGKVGGAAQAMWHDAPVNFVLE